MTRALLGSLVLALFLGVGVASGWAQSADKLPREADVSGYMKVAPGDLMVLYLLETCPETQAIDACVGAFQADLPNSEYVCGDWICRCNGALDCGKLGISGKCSAGAWFNPFTQKGGCLKALGPLDPF